MNIKNIDKPAFAKALGLVCLSWLALIPLYIMLKGRRKWEEEKEAEIKNLKKQIEKEREESGETVK